MILHTKESLIQDLSKTGILGTDTLLVHSSMKSIGQVDGGADTVLDAFSEYMEKGLLVMPAHTWSYINAKEPLFDVRESKSCVGVLTELFRNRPGVVRTLHPTHSLCALGADARTFTDGQQKFDTPCSPQSCYGTLETRNAKVLLLGVNFGRNTLVHCIEEVAKVSGRITDAYEQFYVKDYDGNRISVPSRRHDHANSETYVKLEPVMFQRGILQKVKFGDADCLFFNTKGLFSVTLELLRKYPRLFDDFNPVPN